VAAQNQKKPAAASKGVGAILGEAADVVVGKYVASGPGALGASSAYLNRLSEIQIQDEAYIHQQLVKPDEGGPCSLANSTRCSLQADCDRLTAA